MIDLSSMTISDTHGLLASVSTTAQRIIKARMNINSKDSILVLIASYCDLDLQNTIDDIYAQATNKSKVHFFVLNQHPEQDSARVPQGFVQSVHPSQSRGVCWARNICQKHVGDFGYVLQVDSHTRMAEGWDNILTEEHSKLPSGSIISGYPSEFSNDLVRSEMAMNTTPSFASSFVYIARSKTETPTADYKTIPLAYISCAFLFTDGDVYKDLVFPDDIFFVGEEDAITIGAYTKGYNAYQLTKPVIWHNYLRENRLSFVWDDKPDRMASAESEHRVISEGLASHMYFPWMGDVRNLIDYELEFGVDFATYSDKAGSLPCPILVEIDELPVVTEEFPYTRVELVDADGVLVTNFVVSIDFEHSKTIDSFVSKGRDLSLTARTPIGGKYIKRNCKETVESVLLVEELTNIETVRLGECRHFSIKEV